MGHCHNQEQVLIRKGQLLFLKADIKGSYWT